MKRVGENDVIRYPVLASAQGRLPDVASALASQPSRPGLPELFEQGHEFAVSADRVEIGVRGDLFGALPAAFEGEAKRV